jgi:hypothetical protein
MVSPINFDDMYRLMSDDSQVGGCFNTNQLQVAFLFRRKWTDFKVSINVVGGRTELQIAWENRLYRVIECRTSSDTQPPLCSHVPEINGHRVRA